ncbi:MAG: C40 family peptidase [Acetatifactor muris]|nr:C40 family peptidase [Acetatifactor muris]
MRGQHYRARDKTVRKMGRDGLTEENLRSGETVRVSRRETDRLTLPGTADDSMDFQNRRSRGTDGRKAEGKRRGGYSTDFQRPENAGADGAESSLHRTDLRETESPVDFSPYNVPDREKRYIPEPLAARYRRQESRTQQGRKAQQEASYEMDRISGTAPENPPDTGHSTASGMPTGKGNRTSLKDENRGKYSEMRNDTEKQEGSHGDSGMDGLRQDNVHNRKKKQVYAHARKTTKQKRAEEGQAASARREEERYRKNQPPELPTVRKSAGKRGSYGKLHQEPEREAGCLSFGEEGGMVRGAGMGLIRRTAVTAASVFTDDGQEEKQEDMGAEALRYTGQAGEKAFRYLLRPSSRRMQKNDHRAGEETTEAGRKRKLNKFYQKQRIKKAYAEAKRGEKAAAGAVKETGSFLEKAKRTVGKVFRKKKDLLTALLLILAVFLFFVAGLSSCSAMVQGTSSTFIGTTYPSEDEDIYNAENDYKELEERLDEQINTMEVTHPGYDEYRYQVDEIAHNPYQLISFLTVLYEEFTYGQVKDRLPELFAEQYSLTLEEIVEIRTRTETVTDPVTGEETEQEVEYEWHVLCIRLENKGFDAVARGHMTQEQAAHYSAYNMTYGNRSYLFDVAGIPADGSSSYEIPAEALNDEQFARMIREAEKYLGRAYVWGGASPETGFDCSGFVGWVINNSGNGWDVGRQTAEGLRQNCTAVSVSEAKPGDLVFFQGTYNTSGASHVGIYAGEGMMIHAGNPVKYSNINSPYWQGHFLSFGRVG